MGEPSPSKRDTVVLATKGYNAMGDGPNDRGSSRVHLTRPSSQVCAGSVPTTSTSTSCTTGTTTPRSRRAWPHSTASSGRGRSATSGVRTSMAASWSKRNGQPDRLGGAPLVSLQPQYSLIWRDIELDILPTATRHGMGVIVWSPLGGGMLTGKYTKRRRSARRRPIEQRFGHGSRRDEDAHPH